MFKYYNANYLNNKTVDCAIRSISLGTFKSWKKVYDELSENARNMGLMMDSSEAVENYLDKRYDRICFKDMTLGEFAKEYNKGIYIVSMIGHLTCVVQGNVYDIFDPSNRYIKCAWRTK